MTNSDDCEAGVGFANQVGFKTDLDDTKFSYQLIITTTLSKDPRKGEKLLKNSANSPFYDFASNFCVFVSLNSKLSLLW